MEDQEFLKKALEEAKKAYKFGEVPIGALIVIEMEIDVDNYIESGTVLDAKVSKELLITIFWPGTPLHDGAVVVKKNRIYKAGAFLPLTLNPNLPQTVGTRHRAAIGISEETDAVTVVVSEETGAISVSYSGKLIKDIDPQKLKKVLTGLLIRAPQKDNRFRFLKRKFHEENL
jgi:diadenylate cyclase